MKMLKLSAICTFVVLLLTSAAYVTQKQSESVQTPNANSGKGFAVLELFTSEGCSSCPSADELMERIQKEAADKPVYVLAYHVDYWNRLGWKDVYSNAPFSKRQYWYHSKFTSQVYTPQLILNGINEFVGSDAVEISTNVAAALKEKKEASLVLKAVQSGKTLQIQYQITGNQKGYQLVLALVQKHAISKINAGENEGRTLSHAQIVRQLNTFSIKSDKDNLSVTPPIEVSAQDCEIIGFLQNPETGEISAAAKTTI